MMRIVCVSSWEHTNRLRQGTFIPISITSLPLEPACYVPINQEFLKDVTGVPLWVRGVEPGGQRREQGSPSRFSAPLLGARALLGGGKHCPVLVGVF